MCAGGVMSDGWKAVHVATSVVHHSKLRSKNIVSVIYFIFFFIPLELENSTREIARVRVL
jgi:hypothetical protein